MKLSFKSLMGSIPKGGQTADQVTAAGVTVRKKDRPSFSTSDKLKLSRAAREGGIDKFCFFETDGRTVGDFQTVYDLNMRIEALSKTLSFFDMIDVFRSFLPPPSPFSKTSWQLYS